MPEPTHTLGPGLKKEASPVDSRIAVEPCVVRKGGDPLLVASLSVLLGQQDGGRGAIGFCDDPDASIVRQFVGREHSSAVAHGP
jgi:hypothetical protein